MTKTQHDVENYLSHIGVPVTKEELINGLLVANAPGRLVDVVERLPRDRYQSHEELRRDVDDISRVLGREVASAHTFEEFLPIVIKHTGDVRYATKDRYNRVVEHVIHLAQVEGSLDAESAQDMSRRLEAAFADIRGSMTSVTNDEAQIDPMRDLPPLK